MSNLDRFIQEGVIAEEARPLACELCGLPADPFHEVANRVLCIPCLRNKEEELKRDPPPYNVAHQLERKLA